jgi:hypothetical protein
MRKKNKQDGLLKIKMMVNFSSYLCNISLIDLDDRRDFFKISKMLTVKSSSLHI